MIGSDGNDRVQGNFGEDKQAGGSDAAWLNGDAGDDELVANTGDDISVCGDGADDLNGNTPTEAVLVNNNDAPNNALAVLYDSGADAPEITVTEGDAGVYTVLADGIPVAIVASAEEALTASDVLLVERKADGTVPMVPQGAAIQ